MLLVLTNIVLFYDLHPRMRIYQNFNQIQQTFDVGFYYVSNIFSNVFKLKSYNSISYFNFRIHLAKLKYQVLYDVKDEMLRNILNIGYT